VLFEMAVIHSREGVASKADLGFNPKRLSDIDRLAMVGDGNGEQGMSGFCTPFTTARIRYFDRAVIAERGAAGPELSPLH
jgi:hypothetical protein